MSKPNRPERGSLRFFKEDYDSEQELPIIGKTKRREESADMLNTNIDKNKLIFNDEKPVTFSSNRRK